VRSALVALVCLLSLPTSLVAVELAKDGATAWKIVLPNEPTTVEKTAARELAEHLKQVTGAEFPTVAESEAAPGGKSLIFVGNTAKAPKKAYRFDEIAVKMDGKLGTWGVYDAKGKRSLKTMVLSVKNFAAEDGSFDKKFRWIELGEIDFVAGAYFWFAHAHHPALDAIFVDRVVLIAVE